MDLKALRGSIRNELKELGVQSPILAGGVMAPKLYEIYITACVTRALRGLGATLEVRDHFDKPTPKLTFRLAPGLIYAPNSNPGFILIEYHGNEYELHSGLRVLGKSKVLHELDVCVLERDRASRSRMGAYDPPAGAVKCLIEAKFYGTQLPLSVGREFLGLSSEFSTGLKSIVANVGNADVKQLLATHSRRTHFELDPSSPDNEARFVHWLSTELDHSLVM